MEVLTLFDIGEKAKAKSSLRTIAGSGKNRNVNDFYSTPEIATISLLESEKFSGTIWEPACGIGAISEVLIRYGYNVLSTDLVDRGYGLGGVDFFRSRQKTDNIITNPPYKCASKFVRHAVDLTTGKVAMLLRLAFLETRSRLPLFTELPLRCVKIFSDRVPFVEGNAIAYAWYVWEHGYSGKPVIEWI